MIALKNIILFTTAVVAISFGKRAPATVQNTLDDIDALSTSLEKVTAVVNSYSGGLLAAASIPAAVASIDIQLISATKNAGRELDVSVAEAQSVLQAISDLQPSIVEVLAAVTSKGTLFHAAGLDYAVMKHLQVMQKHVDSFAQALLAHADPTTMLAGQALIRSIDEAFEAAIAPFKAPLEMRLNGEGNLEGPLKIVFREDLEGFGYEVVN